MKQKRTPNLASSSLTREELEQIVYSSLRDAAQLFPQSVEDLEVLESELEGAQLPKPDVEKLIRMLRGEIPRPLPKLPQHGPEPILEVTESLALAARHGKEIAEHIRAKMNIDRATAEREKLE